MYPDERINFLSKQSCSNFYKLMHDLNDHSCCLVLGAGASATVGLPVWSRLLKRICHCYFEQWSLDIDSGKGVINCPPSNVSIALTNSYEMYLREQENPELILSFKMLLRMLNIGRMDENFLTKNVLKEMNQ